MRRRAIPEFFDYDPLKGITRYFDYAEDTGVAYIRSEQDVEPLLAHNAELRNTRACDSGELQLWAMIPPVVQLELRKKGIDIFSKDQTMLKRMRQEIEANYPYLKTTDKKYWRPV